MWKILILHDNRGFLARSLVNETKKVDIPRLEACLLERGFEVEVKSLHQLVFPSKYANWFVLYPSSEDYGLFYKSFIEDIMLRLQMEGAVLLPPYEFLRAHHNKVFMELCRTKLSTEYQTIRSLCFYSIGDLKQLLSENRIEYPVVIKSSAGAGSIGVRIAYTEQELLKKASQMGRVAFYDICQTRWSRIRHSVGRLKRRLMGGKAIEKQEMREKLIIQTFVSNLECDYKVLAFGEKFYLLKRYVREGEFRASGSGNFEYPEQFSEEEKSILEFAYQAYRQLQVPMLSIDIAYDGARCHMLEFQCIHFGPYTLQYSPCFYRRDDEGWIKVPGKSILEEEMASAVECYIVRGSCNNG